MELRSSDDADLDEKTEGKKATACSISHLVLEGSNKLGMFLSLLHAPYVVFLLLCCFPASLIFSLAHRREDC